MDAGQLGKFSKLACTTSLASLGLAQRGVPCWSGFILKVHPGKGWDGRTMLEYGLPWPFRTTPASNSRQMVTPSEARVGRSWVVGTRQSPNPVRASRECRRSGVRQGFLRFTIPLGTKKSEREGCPLSRRTSPSITSCPPRRAQQRAGLVKNRGVLKPLSPLEETPRCLQTEVRTDAPLFD
jgi:hypothetical protein